MPATATQTIHITYFAILREQRGQTEETLHTGAHTAGDLYDSLRAEHGFALSRASLKVAINDEFATWDYVLRAGDRVTFIPPVAGG